MKFQILTVNKFYPENNAFKFHNKMSISCLVKKAKAHPQTSQSLDVLGITIPSLLT